MIVLVFLVIGQVSNRRERPPRPFPADKPYPASEAANMTASGVESGNDVKWGRDPFLLDASSVKERGMEDLEINGIISDKQSPYAIINNDVVKLGDQVNGMTVIEINENNVVLEQDGQKHTLELNVY